MTAVKLEHRTPEVRRMRAVEQVAKGAHPEDVAVTTEHRLWMVGQAARRSPGIY